MRTQDNQFYKDVFKKLIFALEQHQSHAHTIPLSTRQDVVNSPLSPQFSNEPQIKKSLRGSSRQAQNSNRNAQSQASARITIGESQFVNQNSLIPFGSPTNTQLLPHISAEEKRSTFMEMRQESQTTTNDILYLKRLLFLKATLDQTQ